MELNLEQLRSVARGVDRITQEQDGFHFHRFTAEQEELYRVTSADFYKKTTATSGVSLVFETDSRTLGLSVCNTVASSRRFGYIDVAVNGEMIGHLGAHDDAVLGLRKDWDLENGTKTIRIDFPQLLGSVLQALRLDDGAALSPVSCAKKMLLFGDSITQGYDALYPSHSYATRLSYLLNADGRNKGIGGEVFRPSLARCQDAGFEPDIITVAYGTNDWSCHKDADRFAQLIRDFYVALSETYPHAAIFALSPIWRGNWRDEKPCGKPFAWVADQIDAVAAELPNVRHLRGIDMVPHDRTCYSPDVLHPNDLGFATYAERLYCAIAATL